MRRAIVLLSAVLGCSTTSGPQVDPEPGPSSGDESSKPEPEPAVWGTPLIRGEGHEVRITEVWLDGSASAALTLDGFGQVRLWPSLADEVALADVAPIRLPIHEPSSLSFTRTNEGFVIAAIDTARAGRVIEVRIDEAGEARMIERFSISPADPLLELHVLEGGERLLALGVDHRIRLHDGQGKLVAELREHGFIPWQLRVQANRVVAVLGGPTRVQTIELKDDRLVRVGELHTALLDRGANLNDLQLTPDGQRVAVFRRPSSKAREWSLQLIDLDDGEVRVLTGQVDGKIRPRLHLVDDQRALIEDGTGVGYWIDLRQGATRPAGFTLPKDLDDLPSEARVEARRVPLAYSIGRERWHASVVAGIRAVPGDRELVLDPVDTPDHRRLGHGSGTFRRAALSADGSRVAWLIGNRLAIDALADPGPLHEVPGQLAEYTRMIVFVDEEHVLAVSGERAELVAWRSGERVAEHTLTNDSSFDVLGIRERSPGTIEYALHGVRGAAQVTVVDRKFQIAAGPDRSNEFAWKGLWSTDDVDLRGRSYTSHGNTESRVVIRDPDGRVVEFEPWERPEVMAASPDGRWLAVVEEDLHKAYGQMIGSGEIRLIVYAIGDSTVATREDWSMPVIDSSDIGLAWSANSERLAIAEPSVGGLVVTASGEVVFERRHLALAEHQAPDQPTR